MLEIMVWGGISWFGATPLVVFHGDARIRAGDYQKLLHDYFLPWNQ